MRWFYLSLGYYNLCVPTSLPLPSSQAVETDAEPQFRPHRAAILLRHVQSVFHPPPSTSGVSSVLPLRQLDVPQRILVSFSRAVFWAWTQWNDGRIAGIESILIWVSGSRLRPFRRKIRQSPDSDLDLPFTANRHLRMGFRIQGRPGKAENTFFDCPHGKYLLLPTFSFL